MAIPPIGWKDIRRTLGGSLGRDDVVDSADSGLTNDPHLSPRFRVGKPRTMLALVDESPLEAERF